MKLIRIENALDQLGIYHSKQRSESFLKMKEGYYDSVRHPNPDDDSGLNKAIREKYPEICWMYEMRGKFLFGFSSISQLRNWFYDDEFLIEAAKSNFSIVEIEGDITDGYTQAVVQISSITKKESFDLLKYLNIGTKAA